ncbi:unnamed protein product, partial [Brenthis ino]
MSDKRDPGPIPNRWLKCPRKADQLIAGQFLAFKTPLSSAFNEKVPECNRFTPKMLFDSVKRYKKKLGLWIDLTNTSRFYDKEEIEKYDCRYIKLKCRGHGETPSLEQTQVFIRTVCLFMSQKPDDIIGVHCTHGFNRTGFLLIAYLVEQQDCSLEAAIREFARKREPGIYKQDYLEELYRRYDEIDSTIAAPPRPDWCNEEEVIDYDDDDAPTYSQNVSQSHGTKKSKRRGPSTKEFMPHVQGVTFFNQEPRVSEIQSKAQNFCKWNRSDFPGSQPVSMDLQNLKNLSKMPYRVSWKADGVRYMMLIDGHNEIYFIDRDNCVFKVNGISFPHNKDPNRHLRDTLLDGELVLDEEKNGSKQPRYLCYDIIRFENINVGKAPFYPVRLKCIETEIINPRDRAISNGMINKEVEPFRVVLKQFWDLTMAKDLLEEKFARTLKHEPDGLIFQPSQTGYMAGTCPDVLKWKPSDMNSIDFKLKIAKESGLGMLTKKVGLLYVGQLTEPFAKMKVSSAIKHLDNKIIECKFENNQWVFMRERTDKSYPNSYKTATAVWESIQRPVTKEILLDFIDRHRYHEDFMIPQAKRPRQ